MIIEQVLDPTGYDDLTSYQTEDLEAQLKVFVSSLTGAGLANLTITDLYLSSGSRRRLSQAGSQVGSQVVVEFTLPGGSLTTGGDVITAAGGIHEALRRGCEI